MKNKPKISRLRIGRDKDMTITSGRRSAEISACMLTRERGSSSKTTLLIEAVDRNGEVRSVALTGKQARTVFNVMQKHYLRGDKPLSRSSLAAEQRAFEDGFQHGVQVATELCSAVVGVHPADMALAVFCALSHSV